ncbi:MAG: ABC-F family ATP-binding cassette domain-containing protein [Candidatus Andersenbacteria bacterium]|nr:ABC-F family ATP-binding cassette domain-containing protein [Candidatus Andersenbacteria bacterium]MBI3250872.1 ABC-F family ATP-binding cassette domain-containing protein [Candidatus Andersenbacteria bacterium]
MATDTVILRFSDVSFEYDHLRVLLDGVSFSVRTGSRITLMGQNGAGKSSLFKLITGELSPTEGRISRTPPDATIAISRQVMPQEMLDVSLREYFATAFPEKVYALDKLIAEVLDIVHLDVPLDRKIKECSGGQQARLLLAYALIQKPDILLLDEPTNNLDQYGIDHLTTFLMMYEKTCLVISHDADFLNAFSDGVLYLDAATQKIEQYTGNYDVVVEEIKKRRERENYLNARMQTQIKEKRAQAEVFAHKGGKMRGVAKRMREAAEAAEESIVNVRTEDKTIRPFTLPAQEFEAAFPGAVVRFTKISALQNNEVVERPFDLTLRKSTHALIAGPNGIGKSTLLEKLATGSSEGAVIPSEVVVGYYKQDFSNLNLDRTAFDTLLEVMKVKEEHALRSTAAGFLFDGKLLASPIRALSEGQKGLLSFCRLVLLKPGLLLLDEPTNHINFRHLPIIARALDEYPGAMIMVSHIPSFVEQIRIDEVIDLEKIRK